MEQEQKLAALSARVDELESRLAFQEDTLAQLNDVIAAQDSQIRALAAALRELGEKYGDLSFEMQGGSKASDEKPPHY
ncbi:SlyX protein [Microbulbifer donghaiensis]|uniref:Protein SlyX homolog n=1 Tax=Microbulbifer donghaiensis TaxID=494016 RepID=A0A1M4VMS0_9GAMM|nr:SlyX family protein [Microbulbifer donghaiensis]SHE70153.1 SlyX protein [Microbulbifer donghaiensis]